MATVSANGADLFYKEAGEGDPILLIHGSGINADTWGPIFDDLARDHRVVAYDRRGFSRTEAAATSDWRVHGADAGAILRELDMAPATVVGWSSGGIVALDLAIADPGLVSSLVVVDAGLHGAKHPTRRFLRTWLATQVTGRRHGPEAAVDRFMQWTCGFSDGGSVWGEYPEERKDVVRANGAALLVEMRAAGKDRHITRERLAALPMPVTIAYGERTQDWFRVCSKATAALTPQASLETIPGANHALAYTAPDATAELIRAAARAGAGAHAAA